MNVIAPSPDPVTISHKYRPTLEIRRARPMQLYTIQLPGTSIIQHIMPEQHCMRITTVAWVFIEIRVVPARRTMNSMIGPIDKRRRASSDAGVGKTRAFTRALRTSEVAASAAFFSLTLQESFLPSFQPAHICLVSMLIEWFWLAYHSPHKAFVITRTSTFCSTFALLSGT